MRKVLSVTPSRWMRLFALLSLALILAACGTTGQAAPTGGTGTAAGTPEPASTALPATNAAVTGATEEPAAESTAATAATEMPAATAESTEEASETPAATTAITSTGTLTATTGSGAAGDIQLAVSETDDLGKFLVDGEGMTLYLYTRDTPGTSNCYDQCAAAWPPLLGGSGTAAGDDVDEGLVGTTTRKDGSTQITYNGWPLYYYVKDQKPGDVTGQDVGGVWYVISPQGEMVE